MRLALVAMSMALSATASADKLPPGVSANDAALIDRLVSEIDRVGGAMYAVRGKCDKVAAAISASTDGGNKLFAEVVKLMDGPNGKALEAYSQNKYQGRLPPMRDKVEAATLGCRTDKAVGDAWKAALQHDNPRMDADMDVFMLFMQTRRRCQTNAAFAKAVKAAGLEPEKE